MVVPQKFPARLTIQRILAWAAAHHRSTGKWPNLRTGPIDASPGERWLAVDTALRKGYRGLVGDSSLARLLAAKRGVVRRLDTPLTIEQILAWADAHQARTGRWPTVGDVPVEGMPGEAWGKLDGAWEIGIIGKNLSNKYYVISGTDAGAALPGVQADTYGFVARGRQILFQLTLRPSEL